MKRILLITSVLPWPLRKNGGAQRTALMKRALEAFGHVDIFAVGGLALRDEADAAFDQRLREQNVIAALVRQSPPLTPPIYLPGPFGKLWKTVRAYQGAYEADPAVAAELDRVMRENKYDLIVSRYLQPAMQAGVERYPGIPKLLDFDDIDWSTLATAMEEKPWPGLGGKIGSKMVLKTVRQACDGAMHLFGGVFVTSEEDRSLLTCDPIVLPNIPYSDSGTTLPALPPDDGSRELLFVGDLQFPPNRDGLDHFLSRVWPGVTKAVAAATITIVGRGLTEDRRARWANVPGVNVVGFAPDVAECYRRCAMSVVPIYTGGGTKIKILESLAFGRTVATTSHAMRGYQTLAEPHPAVAVAETDEQMIEACVMLLNAPPLRNAMAARGCERVEQTFSFRRFSDVVASAVNKVVN